mmetsp:Transcript_7658/g.11541  ORF Transcript_7658/g.11541 Transcript_7658/m.11541 type:complete len:149 (+) Transcript_7658:174-620(+)
MAPGASRMEKNKKKKRTRRTVDLLTSCPKIQGTSLHQGIHLLKTLVSSLPLKLVSVSTLLMMMKKTGKLVQRLHLILTTLLMVERPSEREINPLLSLLHKTNNQNCQNRVAAEKYCAMRPIHVDGIYSFIGFPLNIICIISSHRVRVR